MRIYFRPWSCLVWKRKIIQILRIFVFQKSYLSNWLDQFLIKIFDIIGLRFWFFMKAFSATFFYSSSLLIFIMVHLEFYLGHHEKRETFPIRKCIRVDKFSHQTEPSVSSHLPTRTNTKKKNKSPIIIPSIILITHIFLQNGHVESIFHFHKKAHKKKSNIRRRKKNSNHS